MAKRHNQRSVDSVRVAQRRQKVAELYLKGLTQWEIAHQMGVAQVTISRDLRKLQKRWLARAESDLLRKRAMELAKIDRVERMAWEGWTKSTADAVTVTTRMERGSPPPSSAASRLRGASARACRGVSNHPTARRVLERVVRGQCGDVRFLEMVCKCIDQRSKLLGLYEQLEGTGQTIVQVNWGELTAPKEPAKIIEAAQEHHGLVK